MAWSDPQVASFARQIAHSSEGKAWWAFTDDIRDALIDRFVLGVVLAQEAIQISVSDVQSFRTRLGAVLASRHGMTSLHSERAATNANARKGK